MIPPQNSPTPMLNFKLHNVWFILFMIIDSPTITAAHVCTYVTNQNMKRRFSSFCDFFFDRNILYSTGSPQLI